MRRRRPTTIGCPYHGLVVDGRLRLDNGVTIDYPAPSLGDTVLVKHPAAPGSARTPEQAADDAARGFDWSDRAIIAGRTRQIHGAPLGGIGTRRWLYCDTTGCTWVVVATVTIPAENPNVLRITVTLNSRFGLFRQGLGAATINRVLATRDFVPTWDNGTLDGLGNPLFPTQTLGDFFSGAQAVEPIPNEAGSRALVCIYGRAGTQSMALNISGTKRFLSDVFTVKLLGAGSDLGDSSGVSLRAEIEHTFKASFLYQHTNWLERNLTGPCLSTFSPPIDSGSCTMHTVGEMQTFTPVINGKTGRDGDQRILKVLPVWLGDEIAWLEVVSESYDDWEGTVTATGQVELYWMSSGFGCVWSQTGPGGAVGTDSVFYSWSTSYYDRLSTETRFNGVQIGGHRYEVAKQYSGTKDGYYGGLIGCGDPTSQTITTTAMDHFNIPFGEPRLINNNVVALGGPDYDGDPDFYNYRLMSLCATPQEVALNGVSGIPAGVSAHPETGEIAYSFNTTSICWV